MKKNIKETQKYKDQEKELKDPEPEQEIVITKKGVEEVGRELTLQEWITITPEIEYKTAIYTMLQEIIRKQNEQPKQDNNN